MTSSSIRTLALALALIPVPAAAQGLYQPVGVSDADALAQAVRRLGSNPLDLDALLTAGELSVRVEDLSAAASFFARAEKIDPRSGRAMAGEGAILVRSQRPAESLRYFARAEQYGLSPARFAADRGMAYDLLGDPGRAQRDYRLALAQRPDAETRRRFALSLGIAGRQAQALNEIAPLLRDNDRAAWRTRAFVLAMGGDAAEASRIAQTMMPPGAAAGLRSFFVELPRLAPVDRAFAVHFGEVRPSAIRLADARLAPRDAPLALEPLPVRVAAVVPPAPSSKQKKRKNKRDRNRRGEVQVAALVPVVVAQPLPQPPAYRAPAWQPPMAATTPVRDRPLTAGEQASLARAGLRNVPRASAVAPVVGSFAAPRPLTAAEQASLAAATIRPTPRAAAPEPARREPIVAAVPAPLRREVPVVLAAATPTPRNTLPFGGTTAASLAPPPAQAKPVVASPVALSARRDELPALTAGTAVSPVVASSPSLPINLARSDVSRAAPVPGFSASPTTPVTTATAAAVPLPVSGEPARIGPAPSAVATTATAIPAPTAALTPGAEAVPSTAAPLAVAPAVAAAPGMSLASTPLAPLVTPPAAPQVATTAPAPPRRLRRGEGDAILARIVAGLTIPASELEVTTPAIAPGAATTRATRRAAVDKALADAKPVADKKLLAERKKAVDKKLADAKLEREAAAEKKRARGEPARIWVQVAGGANEAGLAKAWKATQAKTPALASRQGWTTPLRSTNRVLTGPFKTEAEARAHVNQLAKAGVSAFTFTSEAGQKITRLTTK